MPTNPTNPTNPPEPTFPTGQWEGTSSTGRKLEGFVLQDGSYYIFYSRADRNSVLGGFIQGKGESSFGSFTTQKGHDFNVEEGTVLPGSTSGTYIARQSLGGTFTYENGESFTFDTTYDLAFEKTPTLGAFAGKYPGSLVSTRGVEDVTLKVNVAGDIWGVTDSGCAVSGTGTPRAEGNVFDLSLTFEGKPCLFETATVEGIAYLHPTRRLYLAASLADKSAGLLFATQNGNNPE